MAAISILVVATTSIADGQEKGVSWQSAGDSYSAGEGVDGNHGACAQSDQAYGPASANILRDELGITNTTFTACSGHLIEDYYNGRTNDPLGPDQIGSIVLCLLYTSPSPRD